MRRVSAFVTALLCVSPARALDSVRLNDAIVAGTGTIDLSALPLEAFRKEHGGKLVFAIDVNEALDVSERPDAQGVAIDSVRLRITRAGVETLVDAFDTGTRALLAAAGEPTRRLRSTLLGDSGRKAANEVQSTFDALLSIPVDDLSQATSVVLELRLLAVNATLGDPEGFYDFSGGPESVALVNAEDARVLSQLAAGRLDAPMVIADQDPNVVGWIRYPNGDEFYTAAFEDLFPALGDYDFNDLLVAYRVDLGVTAQGSVAAVRSTAYPIARGARFRHDFRLRLPIAADAASGHLTLTRRDPGALIAESASATFTGSPDVALLLDTGALPFGNTTAGKPLLRGTRADLNLGFDAPIALAAFGEAPFDPFVVVRDTGYEIHLPNQSARPGSRNLVDGKTSFRDPLGFPFAMVLPTCFSFPWERVDLRVAYPSLPAFVASGEKSALDWYLHPDPSATRTYATSDWRW